MQETSSLESTFLRFVIRRGSAPQDDPSGSGPLYQLFPTIATGFPNCFLFCNNLSNFLWKTATFFHFCKIQAKFRRSGFRSVSDPLPLLPPCFFGRGGEVEQEGALSAPARRLCRRAFRFRLRRKRRCGGRSNMKGGSAPPFILPPRSCGSLIFCLKASLTSSPSPRPRPGRYPSSG